MILLSRHSVETHLRYQLIRNSSGNDCLQSSLFAEPLWTDSWPKEWPKARELISPGEKKKEERKHRRGMICRTLPFNPRNRGKATHILFSFSSPHFSSAPLSVITIARARAHTHTHTHIHTYTHACAQTQKSVFISNSQVQNHSKSEDKTKRNKNMSQFSTAVKVP